MDRFDPTGKVSKNGRIPGRNFGWMDRAPEYSLRNPESY